MPGTESGNEGARTALLVGATGLVGSHLLPRLLEDPRYARVVVLARRGLGVEHPKLDARTVEFHHLQETPELLRADDVYCCLGTTKKKAGSKANFKQVDLDYVETVARLARAAGAEQFLLVSSVDADPEAKTFYLRIKGLAEEAVDHLGYPRLHIFRPSLLLGRRRDHRALERLGQITAPLWNLFFLGNSRRYRGIAASRVADSMVAAAHRGSPGRTVYQWREMVELARSLD